MGGLAACVFAPAFSFADIYKYVDPEGVIHFTNAPTHSKFELVLKEERVQFRVGPTFEKYDLAIWKAAEKYGMDYALIKAVIKAESNFNSKAISRGRGQRIDAAHAENRLCFCGNGFFSSGG